MGLKQYIVYYRPQGDKEREFHTEALSKEHASSKFRQMFGFNHIRIMRVKEVNG